MSKRGRKSGYSLFNSFLPKDKSHIIWLDCEDIDPDSFSGSCQEDDNENLDVVSFLKKNKNL
jgi:hypothetical protein